MDIFSDVYIDYLMLSNTIIFRGFTINDIDFILDSVEAKTIHYNKGDIILHQGDKCESIGIVLNGKVNIENTDIWGNSVILNSLFCGEAFGENYAIAKEALMVSVEAITDVDILFIPIDNIFLKSYKSKAKMIYRLMQLSSSKSLELSRKIFHSSSKTIRGRLVSYLSYMAQHTKSREFEIPFNRNQLANYLNVDRSALSYEISKMKKEGIIDCNKSYFKILK